MTTTSLERITREVRQATIRDSVHAVPTVCRICLALQSRVIKGDTHIAERLREPRLPEKSAIKVMPNYKPFATGLQSTSLAQIQRLAQPQYSLCQMATEGQSIGTVPTSKSECESFMFAVC